MIYSIFFIIIDETYKRLVMRIVKTIDPFSEIKEDLDDLMEHAIEKIQSLKRSDSTPFNVELSQIFN